MKRFFALLLALALCLGLCVPAMAAEFSDVPAGHSFREAVSFCAEKGIVGGYSDGTFRPANTVTRGNFCVMLSRAFYADEVAMRSTESNLKYGSFYPNYVTLRFNKVLEQTDFNTHEATIDSSVMNAGISRFEMALMMTNIMNQKGFSASAGEKASAAAGISDYSQIPARYQDAVANVFALGMIGGYGDGSFKGEVTMNRGQAAVVIYRMSQRVPLSGGSAAAVQQETTDQTGTPAQTESPAASTGKMLRDGSAVTEENALKIIEQVKQVYPAGTVWDDNSYRNNDVTIGGRRLGGPSGALSRITNTYVTAKKGLPVSMTGGCGGFAGVVSDAIFGGYDNGGENFPIRKLDSLADIRPGDIILILDGNGKNSHVMTAASRITNTRIVSTGSAGDVTVYTVTLYDGNNGDKVAYGDMNIYGQTYQNVRYEAWTRYPD